MEISEADPVSLPPDRGNCKRSPAIVFGHADGDGHLAAEQSRANLQSAGVDVNEVVVSAATASYRFWERTFPYFDFGGFQLSLVVDVAFDFRNPDRSLEAVLGTALAYPSTDFLIIDHHPLKQPASPLPNLTLVDVDSVYHCCFGEPSEELMVVAAICDGDGARVRSKSSPQLEKRAVGVRRAAADRDVAGARLMNLLRQRRWDFFEALAEEPAHFHQTVRGRRTSKSLASPLLQTVIAGSL